MAKGFDDDGGNRHSAALRVMSPESAISYALLWLTLGSAARTFVERWGSTLDVTRSRVISRNQPRLHIGSV